MKRIYGLTAALGLLWLGACGNGGSAVETRERAETDIAPVAAEGQGQALSAPLPVQDPAPVSAPAPAQAAAVLTSNRRETASAKAVRLYKRNGADFAATSPEDYLEKAKAFTRFPPADAEKISRPNGDLLIYQARTNTFAVVDRRGVVRTMFKPYNGPDYWARQKASPESFGG